jgi:hypothetical protein
MSHMQLPLHCNRTAQPAADPNKNVAHCDSQATIVWLLLYDVQEIERRRVSSHAGPAQGSFTSQPQGATRDNDTTQLVEPFKVYKFSDADLKALKAEEPMPPFAIMGSLVNLTHAGLSRLPPAPEGTGASSKTEPKVGDPCCEYKWGTESFPSQETTATLSSSSSC